MEITKIIAKVLYFASWMVCVLPNDPSVQGGSYDEPTIKDQLIQIFENDEIIENPEEFSCAPFEYEQKTLHRNSIVEDEWKHYQGNKLHPEEDVESLDEDDEVFKDFESYEDHEY